MLNDDKAEFLVIDTDRQRVINNTVSPVPLFGHLLCLQFQLGSVHDYFNFREHNPQICRICYYHPRDIRHIPQYLPLSIANTTATTLIY